MMGCCAPRSTSFTEAGGHTLGDILHSGNFDTDFWSPYGINFDGVIRRANLFVRNRFFDQGLNSGSVIFIKKGENLIQSRSPTSQNLFDFENYFEFEKRVESVPLSVVLGSAVIPEQKKDF